MNLMDRIQSSLYQIRNKLKANSDIRKLLYYTTPDSLEKGEVSYTYVDKSITLRPTFNMNVEDFNRNSFISVVLSELEKLDEEELFNGTLRFDIICKNDIWELNDNKLRPIQIAGILQELLDNEKFDASHKLHFLNMQSIVLDENNSGYFVLFQITEGAGLINEY